MTKEKYEIRDIFYCLLHQHLLIWIITMTILHFLHSFIAIHSEGFAAVENLFLASFVPQINIPLTQSLPIVFKTHTNLEKKIWYF